MLKDLLNVLIVSPLLHLKDVLEKLMEVFNVVFVHLLPHNEYQTSLVLKRLPAQYEA